MKRRYAFAVFLGAFLLFLVQPMAGKRVLPRFGGGPGVWTACLLFFQILLLAGYAYAHAIGRLPRRTQGWLHSGVVALALLCLPLFAGNRAWTSSAGGFTDPVLGILLLLTIAVGLPYFVLSSTGPLLQSWFWADSSYQASPYRLYALSNIASFLALLAYPVLIEPWLALRTQAWMWCGVFLCYAVLGYASGLSAVLVPSTPNAEGEDKPEAHPTYWIALAACGSILLLAVTNHMCQEVAVIPFLWLAPLAIYLATFVLCFDRQGPYNPLLLGGLAVVIIPLNCWLMTLDPHRPYWQELAVDAATLAVCCMICHGELSRSRPKPRRLTLFYLCISIGGALGGLLVAVIAPRVFSDYRELPLGLAACGLLALEGWRRQGLFRSLGQPVKSWTAVVAMAAVIVAAAVASVKMHRSGALIATRNFFGILRVYEYQAGKLPIRVLMHGRTIHGTQMVDPVLKHWATTYYSPPSAIGLAFEHHPRRLAPNVAERGLVVGVVGLGAGTIAALGKTGDTIRFYEINPDVERIARDSFTYLKDSYAGIQVVLGDARVRLEEEAGRGELQGFDVLAVDAFNSDSIPAHLLTAECAALYRRHLKPDGLLLFHISNKALDLAPVTRAIAAELGWRAQPFSSQLSADGKPAKWVVLTRNDAFLGNAGVVPGMDDWHGDVRTVRWTDDFTSLWHVLNF